MSGNWIYVVVGLAIAVFVVAVVTYLFWRSWKRAHLPEEILATIAEAQHLMLNRENNEALKLIKKAETLTDDSSLDPRDRKEFKHMLEITKTNL
jgi:cytochrome c-type biogenesis protein CcmH/NrfG